jgi:hypothetical protein
MGIQRFRITFGDDVEALMSWGFPFMGWAEGC